MKNKFILALALAGSMLTSCNMDLDPAGTIKDDQSLQTLSDAQNFRSAFYSSFRSFTSGGYVLYPSVQCDLFNGLIVNGNNYGVLANGDILSNNDDIEGIWAGLNSRIANINFFMQNVGPMRQKFLEAGDEESVIALDCYIGEARFFRAYYLASMFDRFCVRYTEADGDKPGMGCPIDTIYHPSPDRSSYVGRSTMNQTIAFIDKEFKQALDLMLEWEPLMAQIYSKNNDNYTLRSDAIYISSNAIKAMLARWNFNLGRYDQAISYAKEVIDCGLYPLVYDYQGNKPSQDMYAQMWTQDTGTEIIFSPYESRTELGSAMGSVWLNNQSGAWYIPSPSLIAGYQGAGKLVGKWRDIRYQVIISTVNVNSAFGMVTVPSFAKYPGNPSLWPSGTNNYVNKPKPFRTSELYLIVAEAANYKSDVTTANQYLNALKKTRILGFQNENLVGNELTNEIRNQRTLELVGEGFRLSDLRRWNQGFNRANGANYPDSPEVDNLLTVNGLNVQYAGNDYRYTWPIPSGELQVNPQMAGQQNPGYAN